MGCALWLGLNMRRKRRMSPYVMQVGRFGWDRQGRRRWRFRFWI